VADKTTTDIKHLKEGGFVLLDGVPCKVDRVTISTSGKHGHAKVRLDAIGLFDGTRRSIIKPSHDTVEVPIVEKKEAQVVAVLGDNRVQLMDTQSYEVFEADVPEERKDDVRQGENIYYYTVLDVKTLKELK
jgi:translation initiation factor 5A